MFVVIPVERVSFPSANRVPSMNRENAARRQRSRECGLARAYCDGVALTLDFAHRFPRAAATRATGVTSRPGPVDDRHLDAAGRDGLARLSAHRIGLDARRRGVLRQRGNPAVRDGRGRGRRPGRPPARDLHHAGAARAAGGHAGRRRGAPASSSRGTSCCSRSGRASRTRSTSRCASRCSCTW